MTQNSINTLLKEVQQLESAPLPDIRVKIAEKVSAFFNGGYFDESETKIACDIIRILARDTEILVRKVLAENIKNNPDIPHDIALRLSNDIDEVALPILQFSEALTEGDLISIIRSAKQVAKLKAIAKRENLPTNVSSALIRSFNREIIITLLNNQTANISNESMLVTVKEFNEDENILTTLINRGGLQVDIAEKMIGIVSGNLKQILIKECKIARDSAFTIIQKVKSDSIDSISKPANDSGNTDEIEIIDTTKEKITDDDISKLYKAGRLNSSILMRALCEGNIEFFESSVSRMANLPKVNVRPMLRDKNPEVFKSLFKYTPLPPSILPAIKLIVSFIVEEDSKKIARDDKFKSRLLSFIITHNLDKTIPLMPYVIELISSEIKLIDIVKN